MEEKRDQMRFIGKRPDSDSEADNSRSASMRQFIGKRSSWPELLEELEDDVHEPMSKRLVWSFEKRMPQFIGKRAKMRFIGKRRYLAAVQDHQLQRMDEEEDELEEEAEQMKRAAGSRQFIGKRKSLFIGR